MTLKKISFLLVLILSCATFGFADDASHRKVAGEILDLANGANALKAGFTTAMEPMLANVKNNGASDEAVKDMRAALNDWLAKEIIWDEIKPKMVDLYVTEFTEEELTQIRDFYLTPTGRKTLQRLPVIMAASAKIGQEYAATKQASLMERLNVVAQKHNLK